MLFCEIVDKTEFSWRVFAKIPQLKFHKNTPSGLRFCSTQADNEQKGGQTGTAELKATFRNFANTPKIRITSEDLLDRR